MGYLNKIWDTEKNEDGSLTFTNKDKSINIREQYDYMNFMTVASSYDKEDTVEVMTNETDLRNLGKMLISIADVLKERDDLAFQEAERIVKESKKFDDVVEAFHEAYEVSENFGHRVIRKIPDVLRFKYNSTEEKIDSLHSFCSKFIMDKEHEMRKQKKEEQV